MIDIHLLRNMTEDDYININVPSISESRNRADIIDGLTQPNNNLEEIHTGTMMRTCDRNVILIGMKKIVLIRKYVLHVIREVMTSAT